jgi:two-component system, LuxR family, response regulator FixJ
MASSSARPHVYIVDDDEAVRDSLETYLTLKGMRVTAFASSRELLDRDENGPNLLIVDINMPDMDGFRLIEELRVRGEDAPAVIITGLGDPDARARAERAGAAAVFDKPIDPPALLQELKRLLVSLSR